MIPYGKHHIDEDDINAVIDILRNGNLTQGPQVEVFEHAIKEYVNAKYAVAVSSCTAALHLGSKVAGICPGKSLVTSPITFVASANASLYNQGNVKFADIDPNTINMSPAALERVFERSTDIAVVSPVHFGGLPCDMRAISEIAKDAVIIEDAAHALGGTYFDGSRVGSGTYSSMCAFSFHPVKAIAAGEGGMVTTNDEEIYRELLRLRSHGINKLDDKFINVEHGYDNKTENPWYYEMRDLGYHYRITDIQCALALSQLSKLDKFISRRRFLASVYDEAFQDFENLQPAQKDNRDHSGLHIYVVRIDFAKIGKSRRMLMEELRSRGIGSQVHYIPIPMHPYYQELGHSVGNVPNAYHYYQEALSIPLFYKLSDDDQKHIIDSLEELVG